ncbi:MAG: response regulator [Paracoccus sp. (in: a-proteobacteria)]
MNEAAHVLIVDDDERIRKLLRKFLINNGFMVSAAVDADHARKLLKGLEFDLIVLDVMMPGEDGISLTKALRKRIATPILLLTARGETEDRISGLEAGADDYLAKPFEPRELLLRIAAILRRVPQAQPAGPKYMTFGSLRYDTERGQLFEGEAHIHLTGNEAALLRRLAETPGQAVSRVDLTLDLGRTPSDETDTSDRAIDVQITRLRRKIEPDPKEPRYLQTVRGAGYMLMPD